MFRAFIATLILLASPLVASGDIGVLFGPSPDLPASIVKTIDGAAWTLDVAIYSLDHSDVISSIEKRAQAGVRVRLILNQPNKLGRTRSLLCVKLGKKWCEEKANFRKKIDIHC